MQDWGNPGVQAESTWSAVAERGAIVATEAAREQRLAERGIVKQRGIWTVQFEQRVPAMNGGSELIQAIRDAMAGRSIFVERRLDGGLVQFNYTEPWPRHFVYEGRGNTIEGRKQWRWAWMRRELRGLIMHETGEVVVRGLPKFFNLGQLAETKLKVLAASTGAGDRGAGEA